jgi:cell division protein FtsZ
MARISLFNQNQATNEISTTRINPTERPKMIVLADPNNEDPNIGVIGCGNAGGNAVNRMVYEGINGVHLFAFNTDRKMLKHCLVPENKKLLLGEELTRGMGTGNDPDIGRRSAEEDRERIKAILKPFDMIFITAGLGGGTGTGSSPVIAELASEMGITTVAIVTLPFKFELQTKMDIAFAGLEKIQAAADATLVVPNQRISEVVGSKISLIDAFKHADKVLYDAVSGVSELITEYGPVNLDFNDVSMVMRKKGKAVFGVGHAAGEHAILRSAEMAINSPLLQDASIDNAEAVLINVTMGEDISLEDFDEGITFITSRSNPKAIVKYGVVFKDEMHGKVRLTVIATGMPSDNSEFGLIKKYTPNIVEKPNLQIPPKPIISTPPVTPRLVAVNNTSQPDWVYERYNAANQQTISNIYNEPAYLAKDRNFISAQSNAVEDGNHR